MNLFAIFVFALVVLGAILTTAEASYHKKHHIKHVWKAGKHGKHDYGHSYGKKMTGHSKRYQHMKHGKPN